MASFPASCPIGKTYYYGPNFLESDFDLNSGGDFTDPTEINYAGETTAFNSAMVNLNPAGLQAKMSYTIADAGSANVLASVWYGGGIGIMPSTNGVDPTSIVPSGVQFVAHYGAPRFVINNGNTALFSASSGLSEEEYEVTVTLTIDDAPSGGYYGMTILLEVPELSIDESVYIAHFLADAVTQVNLFVGGPISPGDASTMRVHSLYITGYGFPSDCLGKTIAPWPVSLNTQYPARPAACALGKRTSWYLENFGAEDPSANWVIDAGDFYSENGMASLPVDIDPPMDTLLSLSWVGKILYFAPVDTLSLRLGGRIDDVNATDETGIYDALTLKVLFPDGVSFALISVRRDSGDPTFYQVLTSESYGGDNLWTPSPAPTDYPFEVELRVDVSSDSVAYYFNGVLLYTNVTPSDTAYVVPTIIAGVDNIHRGYLYYFYVSGTPGFPDLCDGDPSPRVTSYRSMLLNLFPTGPLWRNLNLSFRLLMESFATELARIHDLGLTLLRESNPVLSTSALLLPRWEDELLLPEEKPLGTETEEERQQVVEAKLITSGGQSRAFFIAMAANLGITIVITEGGFWIPARVGIARVGAARTNGSSNVFIWNIQVTSDPNSQLTKFKLLVERLKPAHTEVTYT